MMRYFMLSFLFLIFASACSHQAPKKVKAIDPANMDLTVKPVDNFYEYANGNWLKNNPIPAEYSRWGSFEELAEKNQKDMRDLFASIVAKKDVAAGSNLQKIRDFYTTGMDTVKIEKDGLTPLKSYFDEIEGIKTKKDLQRVIADFQKKGISQSFNLFAEQDKKNSEMVIAWLYQGGLGLPDRDYYTEKDNRSKDIRAKYVTHMQNMFKLMGQDEAAAKASAEKVMRLETKMAKASMTRLEQRNPQKTYNMMSLTKLQKKAPGFTWKAYFANMGLNTPGEINVAMPVFFKTFGKLLKNENLDTWKTYLRWHLIHNTADYLPAAFVNEDFAFYGKFLSGSKKLRPRWKRIQNATSGAMGEAVGQLYVEQYFPPAAKERALKLVMNLKSTFKDRIQKLEWMSPETKEKAQAKLAAFNVKIGYPDKWIDYSPMQIKTDAFVLNALRADQFAVQRDLNKIGKPVDRAEWGMTPQTVNAYYHPFMNEIVFPAAILQPPFFWQDADDAVNYGAMGVVIGHEMTHGFDDQGRQFDAHGNMNGWWGKEDAEKFKKQANMLADEFNHFEAVDSNFVNGELTMGENIADLGGLCISFNAMQNAHKDHPAPEKIDGFTPEQRFFLSYAQVWRNNIRKENLLLRLKTDVHSPGRFRTLGPLANLPQFYAAFDVKEGDGMYRKPEKRINIW